MNMRKRAIGLTLLFVLIGVSAAYFLGPSILKRKLKAEFYSKSQIEFEYDKINIISLNPVKISIVGFSIRKRGQYDLAIKSISAELNLLDILLHMSNKSVKFSLLVDDVKSNFKIDSTSNGSESSGSSTQSSKPLLNSFGNLDLKDYLKANFETVAVNAFVKITKFANNFHTSYGTFSVTGSDTVFKVQDLEKPLQFEFNANVSNSSVTNQVTNFSVPIRTKSEFVINHGVFNIIKNTIAVADIISSSNIQINLNTLDFDSIGRIQIPKLEAIDFLKRFQNQLPIANASGAITLDVAAKGNLNSIPLSQVKGQITMTAVTAQMKYKNSNMKWEGPVNLDLNSSFTYINKTPAITSAKWKINLDECEIAYKDVFQKNASIRLASEGTISYINDLNIDEFKLWFNTLHLAAKGMASYQRASDLAITVKPFKLQDFKKFLPSTKDFDISGDVELDGQIKGFLTQPKYLTINLRKIQINNLKYYLNFKNDLFTLEGPISLTVLGNMLIERAEVLAGSIFGQSDLSPLAISVGQNNMKTNTDLFKLNWLIHAKEGKLNIERLAANTFLSSFTIKGVPPLSKEDAYNMILELESLNWKRIKPFLPANEWIDSISEMQNKGTIQVKGKLDPFQSIDSQISIESNLSTNIETMSLPFNFHLSKTENVDATKPEPKPTTPTPFIKNAALLRKIHWIQNVSIQKLLFKDSAVFKNINLSANLINNIVRMGGDVKSMFNGSLNFSDVSIPMTEPDPKIQFTLKSDNISFSPLVEFILPEYKEVISGVANFEVTGVSKLPGSLNFTKDLVAKGRFRIPYSEVHFLKIIEEIKQKIAILKTTTVPSSTPLKSLSASTEAEFEIKNSLIQLVGFKAKARSNDEIELNGQVGFDLNSKINAVIRLVNLPIHGEFLLANQNNSGQVEIPIAIEGNLKQPKWSFVGNTFDKMTQNFLNYQKNRAQVIVDRKIAEAREQATAQMEKRKQEAEKLIEQKKKEMENQAKKQLEELFK